jgi:thymidine phosphorylase
MRSPASARYRRDVTCAEAGTVRSFDNRRLSRIAKLAGAPQAATAGLQRHVRLGQRVERGQPLFTVHAETPGELDYAGAYALEHSPIVIGHP